VFGSPLDISFVLPTIAQCLWGSAQIVCLGPLCVLGLGGVCKRVVFVKGLGCDVKLGMSSRVVEEGEYAV
jgi:hypothetical protein